MPPKKAATARPTTLANRTPLEPLPAPKTTSDITLGHVVQKLRETTKSKDTLRTYLSRWNTMSRLFGNTERLYDVIRDPERFVKVIEETYDKASTRKDYAQTALMPITDWFPDKPLHARYLAVFNRYKATAEAQVIANRAKPKRGQVDPKTGKLLTMEELRRRFLAYMEENPPSAQKKGEKRGTTLTNQDVLALYLYLMTDAVRRLEYRTLAWLDNSPTDPELLESYDKLNVVFKRGNHYVISLAAYKTAGRYGVFAIDSRQVQGLTEVFERHLKELKPKHLEPVFQNTKGKGFGDGFSKYMSDLLRAVSGVSNITATTLRHITATEEKSVEKRVELAARMGHSMNAAFLVYSHQLPELPPESAATPEPSEGGDEPAAQYDVPDAQSPEPDAGEQEPPVVLELPPAKKVRVEFSPAAEAALERIALAQERMADALRAWVDFQARRAAADT